ncbi:hypothetical protein [Pseudomonas sp. H3(2019)]|uniref:hypothetical protein n=1 Tax=Pseudomonas sp. H3(2019) TaxID=2598724 RepID=UPI0011951817|nr:hypothetical protein [Pseudomonas sp. H3(2019)]TVT84916.1 hypothetical protein FPT12_07550 [Pseudomonas sp. H3(2019)]
MNQSAAGKMTRETFWYPVVVATGLIGTVAAVTAVLIKLLLKPLAGFPARGQAVTALFAFDDQAAVGHCHLSSWSSPKVGREHPASRCR